MAIVSVKLRTDRPKVYGNMIGQISEAWKNRIRETVAMKRIIDASFCCINK